MIRKYYRSIISLLLTLLSTATLFAETLPEVRGVWLTTYLNLDWPSAGEKDPARQRQQLTAILDRLHECNFNLVIFQVQANGDVLWPSSLQPAMCSVTGDGKKALSYDLGRFVVEECHRRGMQCHAWLVPFRIGRPKYVANYDANPIRHPYYTCADFAVDFEGSRYLDPGNPRTLDYLRRLYTEFFKNCPYDGISLDYTRYPGTKFPDDASFKNYAPAGTDRDQWRRSNINRFVAMIDSLAQAMRPGITVGAAPIGTYRNVAQWKNATAYGSYCQDPAQWIADGHLDLIIPQMYWDETRGFSDHLATWVGVADQSATLVVGLAPYKIVDGSGWTADNVVTLVEKARRTPGVAGVCFFRAQHIVADDPKITALRHRLATLFQSPAPLPW